MKKTLLFAASIFAANYAMAQGHVSNVNANGNFNIANATQSGVSQESDIDVQGSYNDARAYQSGHDHDSDIKVYGGTSAPTGNDARVEQILSRNQAIIQQGAAGFNQSNSHADVYQNGELNESRIFQGANIVGFSAIPGAVTPGTGIAAGHDNKADIDQIGHQNKALIYQKTSENTALIREYEIGGNGQGTENVAEIGQLGGNGNNSYIDIDGDLNKAWTRQQGTTNTANIDIDGNNNGNNLNSPFQVRIDQRGLNGTTDNGTSNVGTIDITGDRNGSSVLQYGSTNQGHVDITGNDNVTFLQQNGTGHVSQQTISGMNNQTIVTQQP